MEEIKSRSLATVLAAPRQRAPHRALEQRFELLSERLDALAFQAYAGRCEPEAYDAARGELLAQRAAVVAQLVQRDSRWRSLSRLADLNLDELLAELERRGQAALTLFLTPGGIVSVLLKDGRCRLARKELSTTARDALKEHEANLQRGIPLSYEFDVSKGLGLGAGDLVDKSLLREALGSRGLIIVPHESLHLLPWSVLVFERRRLFEWCRIGVLPNLRSILALRREWGAPLAAALIGDPDYTSQPALQPLPNVAGEIGDIAAMYGPARLRAEPAVRRNATAQRLVEMATQQGDTPEATLHVACHGACEAREPMACALVLCESQLDAAEISRVQLSCADVFLSGCYTGWRPTEVGGLVLEGDDILGLPGAFLEAGARAVIVSLTPADDRAAREIAVRYHRGRLRGEAPMAALAGAQADLLREGAIPEWAWAGFVAYACE